MLLYVVLYCRCASLQVSVIFQTWQHSHRPLCFCLCFAIHEGSCLRQMVPKNLLSAAGRQLAKGLFVRQDIQKWVMYGRSKPVFKFSCRPRTRISPSEAGGGELTAPLNSQWRMPVTAELISETPSTERKDSHLAKGGATECLQCRSPTTGPIRKAQRLSLFEGQLNGFVLYLKLS